MIINKTRVVNKKEVIKNYLSWKKDKNYEEDRAYNKVLDNDELKNTEKFIIKAHEWQFNRVDKKPFHNHPIWVAKIISSFISDDLELIQAWLAHDVIEDCENWYEQVEKQLWVNVLELVKWVTEIDKKHSWDERKEAYLKHLWEVDLRTTIVSLADHMHNIHRILVEYIDLGEDLWEFFWAKKSKKINYFYKYADILNQAIVKNIDKIKIWDYKKGGIKYTGVVSWMYSDYIILLDFLGDISTIEINTKIDFDMDKFIESYNSISDKNGGYHYQENENTQFTIYDYVLSWTNDIEQFAKVIYRLDQEY